MRDTIRFLRGTEVVEVAAVHPTETLLDYLRLSERATGTKEGCGEGDCGACTVALGRLEHGKVVYRPVNACIQLLGMVDGAHVVTVEDIGTPESPHPVQAAMVSHHGSQCGFCTPGIVMSLFVAYQEGGPVSREVIEDRLAGNLCRCTGYRPIIDAAAAAITGAPADAIAADADAIAARLEDLRSGRDLFVGTPERFFAAPSTLASLAEMVARFPDAVLVAGATDVGLWVTKELKDLAKIIWLGRVEGLDSVTDTGDMLVIGATATFDVVQPAMASIDEDLGELWRRIASKQVRSAGTVGGNVANGSPIGDSPPALIALGAQLELRSTAGVRIIDLEDFFIAYRRQDRRPGEFVSRLFVPKLKAGEVFRAYKISKRFDQDISAVMAAFRFTLEEGRIVGARLAFGGMAGTPKRAFATEAALIGLDPADAAAAQAAAAHIATDFTPMDDHRASAAYRRAVAEGLIVKALAEIAGAPTTTTRVRGLRHDDAPAAA